MTEERRQLGKQIYEVHQRLSLLEKSDSLYQDTRQELEALETKLRMMKSQSGEPKRARRTVKPKEPAKVEVPIAFQIPIATLGRGNDERISELERQLNFVQQQKTKLAEVNFESACKITQLQAELDEGHKALTSMCNLVAALQERLKRADCSCR